MCTPTRVYQVGKPPVPFWPSPTDAEVLDKRLALKEAGMPLDAREAFKVGFLAKCAETGMGREEIMAAVKTASDKLAGIIGDVGGIAGGALSVAAPVALLAPPILGGVAGAGLAKAMDVDDRDVKEVKDREVIEAYQTEAARLRRQRASRDYQKARASTGRIFF